MADEADRAQAQVDAFIVDSLARAKTAPGPAPDIIDDAQAREAQFLAQALARAHAAPG